MMNQQATIHQQDALQADFQQAFTWHEQGMREQARQAYLDILATQPRHFSTLHMLGVLEAQDGKAEVALQYLMQALQVFEGSAAAWTNCGNSLNELRRWQEAQPYFERAIQLDAEFTNAYYCFAISQFHLNQHAQAQQNLQQVLAQQPHHLDALRLLLQTCIQQADWQAAWDGCQRLLQVLPDDPDLHLNSARVLQELKRFDEALDYIQSCLALTTQHGPVYAMQGLILMAMNQPQQAIPSLQLAIQHNPQDLESMSNLGLCWQELQQMDKALDSFERALALSPQHVDLHWNQALAFLLLGDFAQGWQKFEWRLKLARNPQPEFTQTSWRGEQDLAGKTILIYAEQGLGDTLQFCRYVPMVAALGAKVIFAVPKLLMRLMAQVPGVMLLASEGQTVLSFDYHCPLMSLPLAFNTTLDNIPQAPSYLVSYQAERQRWLERLGAKRRLRIGLVWSGRPEHGNDVNRSIPLQELLPYLPSGADYISLQKEVRERDQAALQAAQQSHQLMDVREHILDFVDTAALCDSIDLLVSVDTSVAHLAAAMGRPTYLLLPFTPDYRWLLARKDSPWYPSVRLYRQHQHGDWQKILQQLQQDLQQLIHTPPSSAKASP